ncbi:phosphoribosyl-AMP cyclohydrolase [Aurantivibrio infirmus]
MTLDSSIVNNYLDAIRWTAEGLVPAIAQDASSDRILMMAWMNREALALSVEEGQAVYWSRSRCKLWRKGETSGHIQTIKEIQLDCDADVILLKVEQQGGVACHTGRQSCFFRVLRNGEWKSFEPIVRNPSEIYPGN